MKNILLTLLLTFGLFSSQAQEAIADTLSEAEMMAMYQAYTDSVMQTLSYETGEIKLKNGIATITVPTDYKYLNGENSEMVLTDLWGNPPSEGDAKSLGMLLPANSDLMSDSSYVINITYSEEGYVDDSDAKDIDYDELLAGMREDLEEANAYREEMGYPTVSNISWASKPYYDGNQKKLYWAKDIAFDGQSVNTLNYNIRVLGRKGYLQMNVIGEMPVLPQVNANMDNILPAVNFTEGNRYADFNPDIDKVAAYGIGGLIAGKVLLKAGILAKLGLILAKFWKFIAFGVIALVAGVRKLFGGKEPENTETPVG